MCNILSMLIIILLYSAKFWWEKCSNLSIFYVSKCFTLLSAIYFSLQKFVWVSSFKDSSKFYSSTFSLYPFINIISCQNFAPYSNGYSTCVVWSESTCSELVKINKNSIWYRKRGKIRWAKLSRFWRGPRKFSMNILHEL